MCCETKLPSGYVCIYNGIPISSTLLSPNSLSTSAKKVFHNSVTVVVYAKPVIWLGLKNLNTISILEAKEKAEDEKIQFKDSEWSSVAFFCASYYKKKQHCPSSLFSSFIQKINLSALVCGKFLVNMSFKAWRIWTSSSWCFQGQMPIVTYKQVYFYDMPESAKYWTYEMKG